MMMAMRGSIRAAVLAAASVMGLATVAAAQCTSPSYSPDFSANQSCLALNAANSAYPVTFSPAQGSAPTPPTVLRLTPAVGGLANSAWFTTAQDVTTGFSTTFTFQMGGTTTPPIPADGIAFVIQNSGTTALGPGGCGIGFGGSSSGCAGSAGIPSSVAVEFNTFNNGGSVDPNSANDVAIQSCGAAPNSVDYSLSCGVAHAILPNTINMTDGAVHTVTVTYKPSASTNCGAGGSQTCSALDVVIDGTDVFNGAVLFDMTTVTSNTAYVGFTAGTGGNNEIQDITSWTYTPMQTQTGTVTPTQTNPTTFNYNGGFAVNNANSGYNFSAQQTTSNQTVQMQVTAIALTQGACNSIVQQNLAFATANCFVYQNGGGTNHDAAVMFEVTCPATGSCGNNVDPFYADLGTQFSFTCTENLNLQCPANNTLTSGGSFGLPHLTYASGQPSDGLPSIGFLKGEGPDPQHPCTPGATPLFTSNQIEGFKLGDTSGGAKGGSGGTTSCWVMTYLTQPEAPSVKVAQPANNGTYVQNQSDPTTSASYTCTAVSTGDPSSVAFGPYLSIPPSTSPFAGVCAATDSVGGAVANGAQFDTSTLGPHTFTAQVQDSAMNSSQTVANYTVVAAPVISGPSSALFTVGTPNSVGFSATGYPTPTLSESGALPGGVTFAVNTNGMATLSGTATTSGIYPITITAWNGVGTAATLAFTLTSTATVPTTGTKCNGVYDGTFKGNLTVTTGQTCIFIGGGVTGNISQTGGTLMLTGATVTGNFQAIGGALAIGSGTSIKGNVAVLDLGQSAAQNTICGSVIGGSLQVVASFTPIAIGDGTASCPGNTIGSSVTVTANAAATTIYGNSIGGSLTDAANLKPTQVFSNKIKGSLTCTADASITGGGNTAAVKQGQCAKF
jgi:hypothetical protein